MRKLRSREGRDSGGTGSKWLHCQAPHLCSPNLPVNTSSSLWHQQNSAHRCQPDSMVPAANTGKGGLGRGGRAVKEAVLEGGAGWHLCWIQKRGGRVLSSRQWPWGGRNPGVSARQEREAGGQGEGRRRCEQAQKAQGLGEENKQTSAPSGSSPTPQTLAGRRPGWLRPAEKQGAIHSCCLQNLGLQSPRQAPRLRFHSNAAPQNPSKEIRPRAPPARPRTLVRLLTRLTPTVSEKEPYVFPQPPPVFSSPAPPSLLPMFLSKRHGGTR